MEMHRSAGKGTSGVFHPVASRAGYPGQFETPRDALGIAIPREEIITEMARCGEDRTLDLVCISVAVVLDALARAVGD